MDKASYIRGLFSLVMTAALAGGAFAQGIGVNVNGQAVRFSNIGPRQISGRVLVPVRGVLESLGAYVGYDHVRRLVTATRGDVDIALPLDQRVATVNGRQVTLDVPAQIIQGSTMVPLRFLGEALGAEVTWNPTAQTVNITTGAANTFPGDTDPTPTDNTVQISSFRSDTQGPFRPGSTITYVLQGSPGGSASFQIPGLTGVVPMREESAGRYVARLTIPNDTQVTNATPTARLVLNGRERTLQASETVSIDVRRSEIIDFRPTDRNQVRTARPNITASFSNAGEGIEERSVRVYLDGRDVTRDADITNSSVTYRPTRDLESGIHDVEITARDRSGDTISKRWSFEVISASQVIRSFTFTGNQDAQPGDVIRATLVGEPDGTASFSIGQKVRNITMREVSRGRYVGEYTVRRGDDLQRERIVGRLRLADGEVFTSDGRTRTGSGTGYLEAPEITSPSEGDRIGNTLVVRGITEPRTRVRVRLETQSGGFWSIFGLGGRAAEQEVVADANGRFVTRPFDLSSAGSSSNLRIKVVALDDRGEESDPTEVVLRK